MTQSDSAEPAHGETFEPESGSPSSPPQPRQPTAVHDPWWAPTWSSATAAGTRQQQSGEYGRRGENAEPPVVVPPWDQQDAESTFHDVRDWFDRALGGDAYGAPRVFDLFTMLAITLAFALMFAFLRLIEPLLLDSLATVAVCLGFFVTGIAIFQLALWGGKKPRHASLIGGPILWVLIGIGISLPRPAALTDPAYYMACLCSSILGVPAGYLGGAMVAGVFLLADFFRVNYLKKQPTEQPNDDQVFVDSEDSSEP